MHRLSALMTACVALLLTAAGARAQSTYDHLECYTIKDTRGRTTATADVVPQLPPFASALGCRIKLPAREYCTAAAKQHLDPPPASNVAGSEPGDYFCYDVACPRSADLGGAAVEAEDQFGRRTMLVRKPKRLCVPATRATPTPVATPTGTTPVPTSTFGLHDPGCSFDGTECQGYCRTANRCLYDPAQSRCVCPPYFDADCDHTVEAGCGTGQLCYGPNQICGPNPQATAYPICACVPKP